MKAIEILNDLLKNKKVDVEKADWWRNDNKSVFNYKPQALSLDELIKESSIRKEFIPAVIPEALYNKQFTLGEFDVIVQYASKQIEHAENEKSKFEYGYKRMYFGEQHQWNVVLKYHGVYILAYKWEVNISTIANFCLPTQTNWFHITFTEQKPYVLQESTTSRSYDGFKRIKEFLNILDVKSLNLVDQKLDLIEPNYNFEDKKKKLKTIHQYSEAETDFKWLVSSEVKKGVYTPEAATIKWLLFQWRKNEYDTKTKQPAKNVLHELGVKRVQLRSDAHFDLTELFDIKGVSIKAPQKIIEAYGYSKYADKEVADKIAQDKAQAKKDEELLKYNRQFTLVQHGKTILENVDLSEIQYFLENFKVSKSNFEDVIFSKIKPVFDAHPEIKKFNLAAWGTYYKYECAGESYFNFEVANEHIDEDTLEDIETVYGIDFGVDEDTVLIKYGRVERGGTLLSVVKDAKGKLKLQTENYDPE